METKRCPRCGKSMKKKEYGFFHCSCGNSWMAGKGFFMRTPDMECTFEEQEEDGVTVRVPVIRYHKKTVPGEQPEIDHVEKGSEEKVTEPFRRKAQEIIRGGIYFIEKHIPEEGHEQHSGRPAVVVSDVSEGDFREVVTVVYLTSQDKRYSRTRTLLTSSGIVATALAEQITTVDVRRVGEFLGLCTVEEMKAVKKCMRAHLGLHAASFETIPQDAQNDYIRQLEAQNKALQSQLREQQSITWDLERRLKKY